MALREILVKYGFSYEQATLEAIYTKVEKLSTALKASKGAAEAAGGATGGGFGAFADGLRGWLALATGGAFVHFADEIKEQAAALQDTADQTGLATDEIQAWTLAANLGGASAEDFVAGLRKLSKELATGVDESGKQSKLFKQLHIEAKTADGRVRELSDVLPEVAEKFTTLGSGAERTALAAQLFGKAGSKLVPILSKGAAGVAELRAEFESLGGGFSEEAIANADAYDDSLIKLQFSFRSLKSLLAVSVFPILADVVGMITKGTVSAAGFLKETTAVETAILAVAAALSSKLLVALAPFLLPGLKFLAIFLAVDDLVAFLKGQDSVIGAILNDWFGVDFTNDVRSTFQSVGEIAKGTLGGIYDLWKALTADTDAEQDKWVSKFFATTEGLNAAFDNFFNYAGIIFGNVAASFYNMIGEIEAAWNRFVVAIADSAGPLGAKIKNGLGIDTRDARERTLNAQDAVAQLRNNVENNKDKIAGVQTPAAIVAGPVREPTVSTNYVEVNAPVTVTLPAGTSPQQARQLAREAQKGAYDGHRGALQNLEQRR